MTHTHREIHTRKRKETAASPGRDISPSEPGAGLEIVLKCDSEGSLEAASAAISGIARPEADVSIVHKGLGSVTKSDVFLAETASRLIVGFQVSTHPGVESALRKHNVEVRLYDVIYTLADDLKALAESVVPRPPGEQIISTAKVVALFKGGRKGIIAGCEVTEGRLAVGQHFRIISAMGPVYSGTIESLHIGDHAVQAASPGQQVGIGIRNFNRVKIGDIVEAFHHLKKIGGWRPSGAILHRQRT